MNKKIFLIKIIILLLIQAAYSASIEKNVIQLRVTTQEYDYYSPWQKEDYSTTSIHGCVIAPGLIVTLSHDLHNYVYVEALKLGRQQRYPAIVLVNDYNLGIALLTVRDKSFFEDIEVVPLYDTPLNPGKAVVAKWDNTGILKTYSAELFKTAVQSYEYTGISLFHQMTTTLDSSGRGCPVYKDGKLLGITGMFDDIRKTIQVISYTAIRWLMDEISTKTYSGQPFLWMDVEYLKGDENLKEYLGINKDDTGFIINTIAPGSSGFGVLKPKDIVLSIDNIDIDDDGFCDTKEFGRLNFMYIPALTKHSGDTVTMQIQRDKKPVTVQITLVSFSLSSCLVPPFYIDSPPKYWIAGGLVFQELSKGFFQNWGSDWQKNADKRLLYYFDNYGMFPTPERKRLVVLNRVLPDALTTGYYGYKNLILEKVNGLPFKDIEELYRIAAESKEKFILFEFAGGDKIVLNKEELDKGTMSVLEKYDIPDAYRF